MCESRSRSLGGEVGSRSTSKGEKGERKVKKNAHYFTQVRGS